MGEDTWDCPNCGLTGIKPVVTTKEDREGEIISKTSKYSCDNCKSSYTKKHRPAQLFDK